MASVPSLSEKATSISVQQSPDSDTEEESDGWIDRAIDRAKRSQDIAAADGTASGVTQTTGAPSLAEKATTISVQQSPDSDTEEESDGWIDRAIDRAKRSQDIAAAYATASGVTQATDEEANRPDYFNEMKNIRAQRRLQKAGREVTRNMGESCHDDDYGEVAWLSDEDLVKKTFEHSKECETDGCANLRLQGEARQAMERTYRGQLGNDSIVHATSDSDAEDFKMLKVLKHVAFPQHMFSTPSPYKKPKSFRPGSKSIPFRSGAPPHNLKYRRTHLQAKSFMALKNWKKVIQVTSVLSPKSTRYINAVRCHKKLREYMERKGWLKRK